MASFDGILVSANGFFPILKTLLFNCLSLEFSNAFSLVLLP